MSETYLVQAKTIGVKKPIIPQRELTFPSGWDEKQGHITLRDLIIQVVHSEVQGFEDRQEARRFARVLTERQISEGAQLGKVNPAAQDMDQDVDPKRAVETALLAFTDGFYYVFIDEVQIKELDEIIPLSPDSQVTFLRLVPLVGG